MTPGNLEPLTTKFWNNVNEGKLVRPFCAKCETSFFSPQVLCPVCQSENWEFQESSEMEQFTASLLCTDPQRQISLIRISSLMSRWKKAGECIQG